MTRCNANLSSLHERLQRNFLKALYLALELEKRLVSRHLKVCVHVLLVPIESTRSFCKQKEDEDPIGNTLPGRYIHLRSALNFAAVQFQGAEILTLARRIHVCRLFFEQGNKPVMLIKQVSCFTVSIKTIRCSPVIKALISCSV